MSDSRRFASNGVLHLYTNGKRADDQYGLANEVGRIVKRYDQAGKRAIASTARKASPYAKALLLARYSVPSSEITDRVQTRVKPDSLIVYANTLRIPLVLFGGKWGGRSSAGATAGILLGQTRIYAGSFIAPGRYRGKDMPLIYSRKRGQKVRMKHGRYAGKLREAIVVNRGPSVYDMLHGIEKAQSGSGVVIDADLASAATLRAQLASFYVSELRRLAAVEARNG